MILLRSKQYAEKDKEAIATVQEINPQQDAREFETEANNLLQQQKF